MTLPPAPDPSAPFAGLLGHLVELLRRAPEDESGLNATIRALVARVAQGGAEVEAGIENSWALDGDPLKERLVARQVDGILVAAGAPEAELLALARALADDDAPVPSTARVRVKLIADPLPVAFSGPRPATPESGHTHIPRARPGDQLAQMIEGILHELQKAIRRQQWHAALHNAQVAMRMLPGLVEEARGTFAIVLRRMLDQPTMEALIDQGYHMPEEQARTAEVLRWSGLGGAELMLEILRRSDTVGPRGFLVDALGGMPDALPIVLPLLRSHRTAEARLGAELLGRLNLAEAVPPLLANVNHPDDRVRYAVLNALGNYRERGVVEALRQALAHADPGTRAHAGLALAARGSGAIAMPLLAALEVEEDRDTWRALLQALAGIDASEAESALVRLATTRRGIPGLRRADARRRLEVVQEIAASGTGTARAALKRIAVEGGGAVKAAAAALLRTS